jgi:hypothetical protein
MIGIRISRWNTVRIAAAISGTFILSRCSHTPPPINYCDECLRIPQPSCVRIARSSDARQTAELTLPGSRDFAGVVVTFAPYEDSREVSVRCAFLSRRGVKVRDRYLDEAVKAWNKDPDKQFNVSLDRPTRGSMYAVTFSGLLRMTTDECRQPGSFCEQLEAVADLAATKLLDFERSLEKKMNLSAPSTEKMNFSAIPMQDFAPSVTPELLAEYTRGLPFLNR